jgi:CheY-like chemotaxis protein
MRRSMRVLIVDDYEPLLATLKRVLGARGHSIHCVTTRPAAIIALAKVDPDLVLIDWGLGLHDPNGGEALLKDPRCIGSRAQKVLMTGDLGSDKRTKAAALGAVWIGKDEPFTRLIKLLEPDGPQRTPSAVRERGTFGGGELVAGEAGASLPGEPPASSDLKLHASIERTSSLRGPPSDGLDPGRPIPSMLRTYRDRMGRWHSEGSREFASCVRKHKAREVAKLLGISQAHVSSLMHGTKRPSIDLCADIERLFAIHPAAWARRRDD